MTELNKAGERIFSQIKQSTPAAELDTVLTKARHRVLSNLIDDLLVSQKATELRISVTEQELDSAITNIGIDNNMTGAELEAELARTGVSKEEYRKKLTKQILHSKLLNYEIRSKIVISSEKAREYYDTVYTKQKTPEGYHLLQIGLIWAAPDPASDIKEKTRQKTAGLRKLAVAGQDFMELSRSFSQLPSAKDGGDLGFFTNEELAEYMKKIIIKLKPGQISEIIETKNSYQFFRVIAKNINGTTEFAPFEDISEEITRRLQKEELDKRYKKWVTEIKDQAIITELL